MTTIKFVSIPPFKYVHVKDTESNIVDLFCGPQNLTLTQNKLQVGSIEDMLVINYDKYAYLSNTVMRDANNEPIKTEEGFFKNRIGQKEYRTREQFPNPFPLYPGEKFHSFKPRIVVLRTQALEVSVEEDWKNPVSGTLHLAGDTIMIPGPAVFIPAPELHSRELHEALPIIHGQAIKVRADSSLTDSNGVKRISGETYLYRECGSYLPVVGEVFEGVVNAQLITEHECISMYSEVDHTDIFGTVRKAGDEWLVTHDMTSEYIVDINEVKVKNVKRIILNETNYCYIRNYVDANWVQKWGCLELRSGPMNFFLKPNEKNESGIKVLDVLTDRTALLLFAEQSFVDSQGVSRFSGEKWLFKGPGIYQPHICVRIVERRVAYPLGDGEGIYVKNNTSGEVRAHIGSTYMLKAHESLWEKELSPEIEELYATEKMGIQYLPSKMVNGNIVYEKPCIKGFVRVKHEVVSYNCPFGRAVQLYDFKSKTSKVRFGPELILLQPDEIFTVLNISGGRPKVENAIKLFSLMLGPDFMTDVVVVETSDHATIEIELAYGWHFEYNRENPDHPDNLKLFSIKDFVGNACKSISSRVRGAISSVSYDEFHHKSSVILRQAVFGLDKKTGEIRESLTFNSNNLVLRSCDIKSQRPVDKDIEKKLKQNTFLAIQIKTQATELEFRSQKDLYEVNSKGLLDIQIIDDKTKAEADNIEYYKAKAEKDSIQSVGVSIAKARADNTRAEIEGNSRVVLAQLGSEYEDIVQDQKNNDEERTLKAEYDFTNETAKIDINEQTSMANAEVNKVSRLMTAVGQNTLAKMMNAEPEMQAEMLKSLGLQGYLMTDGRNPINLFDTANGLVHQQAMGKM